MNQKISRIKSNISKIAHLIDAKNFQENINNLNITNKTNAH
jgi:hypothetical protein